MNIDNEKIALSVIVPVYKVEKYLRQCIESIIDTERRDFEVILVDDGSPDGCPAICDEYADRDNRVRVVHQANAGVSAARNAGLAASRGGYISFVDSDDYVEKGYVETIVQNCDGCDMLFFSIVFHCPDGTNNPLILPPCRAHTRQEIMEQMQRVMAKPNGTPFTVTKAFRRSLLIDNNLRFILGLTLCEDTILTYDSLALAASAGWLDAPLYHYRAGLPTSIGHGAHTPNEMKTIAHETARLSRLFPDGYGVSENLRDMAETYLTFYVSSARRQGLGKYLHILREEHAFCKTMGLKNPYVGLVKHIVRRVWQKMRGR